MLAKKGMYFYGTGILLENNLLTNIVEYDTMRYLWIYGNIF